MPPYMIIEIEVLDAGTYAEYMRRVPATVVQYGGKYLVRGGKITPLTGGWNPERIIVLEFPDAAAMKKWNQSAEYLELAPLRMKSTRTRAIALEGATADGSR